MSDTVIHVDDVVYGVPVARTLTLENVGEVCATWRFVPKPEEKLFCKVRRAARPARPSAALAPPPPFAAAAAATTPPLSPCLARAPFPLRRRG